MTNCYRNLAARVILQALNDGRLTGFPSRGWPWLDLHPTQERVLFWDSEWFQVLCDMVDLEPAAVQRVAENRRTGGDS